MKRNRRKKHRRRTIGKITQQVYQDIVNCLNRSERRREKTWDRIGENHETVHSEQHCSALPHAPKRQTHPNPNHKRKSRTMRQQGLHSPSIVARRENDLVLVRGMKTSEYETLGLQTGTVDNPGDFTYSDHYSCHVFLHDNWVDLCDKQPWLTRIYEVSKNVRS